MRVACALLAEYDDEKWEMMEDNKQDTTEQDIDGTEAADVDPKASSKPKKRGKGKIILIAVLALVVVMAGSGGVVYATMHSNPAFCNAVCHTPMDPYVASWENGTSIVAAQADSGAVLSVTAHKESDQNLVCVDCHNDGLGTQMQEGLAWVSGSYTVPLEGFPLVARAEVKEGEKSGQETCLTAGCHEGISSLEELATNSSMSDQLRNPHDPSLHNGALDCTTCHQTHEQSVMWCSQCHADAKVPEGWLTWRESEDLKKVANTAK